MYRFEEGVDREESQLSILLTDWLSLQVVIDIFWAMFYNMIIIIFVKFSDQTNFKWSRQ